MLTTDPIDFAQLRLQYEILNRPLSLLATEANISLSTLEYLAEQERWVQLWPEAEEPLGRGSLPPQPGRVVSPRASTINPKSRASTLPSRLDAAPLSLSAPPAAPPKDGDDNRSELEVLPPSSTGDDAIVEQIQQFVTRAKHRLAAYSVAKEVLLTQRRFSLEKSLIVQAQNLLTEAASSTEQAQKLTPRDLRMLGSLFKELSGAAQALTASTGIQLGADDNGLPMVTIKDLSGLARRPTHAV